MKSKFNKKILISSILIFIVFLTCFSYFLITYLNPKLSEFEILEVKEVKDKLYLVTSKSNNATKYFLEVYDINNNIIYKTKSSSEKIDITNMILDYNTKVTFKVIAKNRKNEKLKATNSYQYTNKYASFMLIKDHYAKADEDLLIYITGNYEEEDYHVDLFYKNKKIASKKDITNKIIINYNEIKDCEGKITAKLYNNKNRIVSIFNFYLNAPEVSDLSIIGPINDSIINYDDIDIYYTGGENATTIKVKLYNENKKNLLNVITFPNDSKKVTIPVNIIKENMTYNIEVLALYQDYEEIAKKDSIKISVLQKDTVKPVYVSKNFDFIKRGTEIELKTDTPDATIYYTIDGTKPTPSSLIYAKPVVINMNTKLRAYAVKNNMYDSVINTYDFKIKDKIPVVYISPSNQNHNYGIAAAGYTTEKEMMNKLADYLYNDLKAAGIKVHRNNGMSGGMNSWINDSNYYKSDFHFAIHSNASVDHDKNGMEIYVDNANSACLSIASNIYHNLYSIYPYKETATNRGVKFANGSLGEVNNEFLRCGALLEVAFHDNYNDASWIVNNMEAIARNMADTIIDYYDINNE